MGTTSSDPRPTGDASAVLFGRTRRRVLALLFGHANERFYLRQIVRLSGAAQGAVQRELHLLAGAGILRRTVEGRQVYFQANRESPIYPALQALLFTTAGLVDVLHEALAPLGDQIRVSFVFGSAARVALRRDSDVEVLVVGDASVCSVAHVLSTALPHLGRAA